MSELIYGRHAVHETLRARRRRIYRLWLEGEERDEQTEKTGIMAAIVGLAQEGQIPIRRVKGGLFLKLSKDGVNAQGVALEVDSYPYADLAACMALAHERGEAPLLLILDHLQDPQNLGTLMRTAEAMGVHGIIIPDRRSAGVTPAVTNASSGAVEHLNVVQVTNINRVIDQLKQANIWVAGLDSAQETPPLADADLSGALALVTGSEQKGLSRLTRDKCDFLIRLPMVGRTESLNAAVAGSIALYAARQARQQP